MIDSRTDKLRKIKDEIVSLKKSPLYEYRVRSRYFPVIGEGNHSAEIMFVGEAPGLNEAKTGRPFCGPAGAILDELLQSVAIDRSSVYITNVVKDRPPGNRDPLPEEIVFYAPFLDRQIEIIQPKVIVTLGRFSMRYVLDKFGIEEDGPISRLHGQIFEAESSYGPIKIVPMFHPAAAIYARATKEELTKDFQKLKLLIGSP